MPDETPAPTPTTETRYTGIAAAPGIAWGPAVLLYADEHIVRKRRIRPEDAPAELTRFEAALLKTRQQIQVIRTQMAASIGESDASIFDAHILSLEDSSLIESVKEHGEQPAGEC